MRAKILVIGDIIVDRYHYVETKGLSQEALIPILEVKSSEEKLGGAGKTATVLGEILSIINLPGGDVEAYYTGLMPASVDTIPWVNNKPVYPPLINGNRNFFCYKNRIVSKLPYQQLTRFDQDVITDIMDYPNLLLAVEKNIKTILTDNTFNITVVSDYDKGSINKKILEQVREKSDVVIVDPRSKKQTYYSNYADIIVPNKSEYLRLLPDPRLWTEYHNDQYRAIVSKQGPNGCVLYYSEEKEVLPKLNVERIPTLQSRPIISTIGAGDVFIAALSAALATTVLHNHRIDKSKNLSPACSFASAVATIATWNRNCSPRDTYTTDQLINQSLTEFVEKINEV